MSTDLGDRIEDSTVRIMFTTVDGAGGLVAPSTAFENADVNIYKDGSATQKTTTNGITMTSPFDSIVGLHLLAIDTNNNTGDASFWERGSDYDVVLVPDETVDGETVGKVWSFSIENRPDSAEIAESGPFAWPATPREMMAWFGARWRNRFEATSTQARVRNDADSANLGTATLSDSGTEFVRDEYS